MKKKVREPMERHLGLFKVPPQRAMDLTEQRVLDRLSSALSGVVGVVEEAEAMEAESNPVSGGWKWNRLGLAFAAAAIVAAFLVVPMFMNRIDASAVVETADGKALHSGERIAAGQIVRTSDVGAMLALADGSHVEVRAKSELLLERADDGVRIRLKSGGVIVSAAKQRTGHLYVQTRDVTVSVVGTVFLVNAEKRGSRVAVIEGEVHVQQGATSKKLLSGEQVATNPLMESRPMSEEISWSQSAPAHLALLQAAIAPANVHEAFEVASVRPTRSIPGSGERGAGGGGGSVRPAIDPCGNPDRFPQIDPGRFATTDTTLLALVLWAYSKECTIERGSDYLSGGPGWIKSDGFDIEARIPEGTPIYTREQFRKGAAPELQKMLQTLLADRFKLALRREMKEVPAYALTRRTSGPRPAVWKDGDGKGIAVVGRRQNGQLFSIIQGRKVSMPELAKVLAEATRRPVVDQTGLSGEFNFRLEFAPLFTDTSMFIPGDTPSGPSLFTVIEQELGLKLEPARAPAEYLTIDHVERPSEN